MLPEQVLREQRKIQKRLEKIQDRIFTWLQEDDVLYQVRAGKRSLNQTGVLYHLRRKLVSDFQDSKPQTLTGPAWREAWAKANQNRAAVS